MPRASQLPVFFQRGAALWQRTAASLQFRSRSSLFDGQRVTQTCAMVVALSLGPRSGLRPTVRSSNDQTGKRPGAGAFFLFIEDWLEGSTPIEGV